MIGESAVHLHHSVVPPLGGHLLHEEPVHFSVGMVQDLPLLCLQSYGLLQQAQVYPPSAHFKASLVEAQSPGV